MRHVLRVKVQESYADLYEKDVQKKDSNSIDNII